MQKCLLFLFSIALAVSCTLRDKQPAPAALPNAYDSAQGLIKEAALLMKEGDLVLRNGQELSSQFIKNFNRDDKTYSHAGFVFFQDGRPLVHHILPDANPATEKLRTDSLQSFCNPRHNAGFAVYRFNISEAETKTLRRQVEEWKAQGVAFDSAFNFKTDDRMYCSEMIKKGLAKATQNRIVIGTTRPDKTEAAFFAQHLRLPLAYTSALEVVAIDNLFLNPHCKQVVRYDFNAKR